ncbi:MAG: cyclase family protein [Clostridia bacterium]|nr:cyclase family protein [Clostridia bacterium]
MSTYVETGYPIYDGMGVYPGLPVPTITNREKIDEGDSWNGSVLDIYLHAGTHCDAPWHFMGGDAPMMDDTVALPIASFIFEHPMLIDCPVTEKNGYITIDMIKKYGDEIYEAGALFFNTHTWPKRAVNFTDYGTDFAALSPEAAEWIRAELSNIKAVGIDTLSIENIAQGRTNGFRVHKALLDPERSSHTIRIIEDYNPEPLIGKKLIKGFVAPLRIHGDATICNPIFEIE